MERFGTDNGVLRWIPKQVQLFFKKSCWLPASFKKRASLSCGGYGVFLPSVDQSLSFAAAAAFNKYLASFPNISDDFFAFLKNINSNIDKGFPDPNRIDQFQDKVAGAIGPSESLMGRLLDFNRHSKGIEIVFKSQKIRTTFVMNVLSLLALTVMLGLVFLAALISIGLNFSGNDGG